MTNVTRKEVRTLKILKDIEDIEFHATTLSGEAMEVSEDIVMASAAGWYVGAICKTTCEDGFELVEPYCRHTHYVPTPEAAQMLMDEA